MELLRLRVDSGPERLDPGRLEPVCGPSRSCRSEISLVKGTRGSSQTQEDLLKSNQIHGEQQQVQQVPPPPWRHDGKRSPSLTGAVRRSGSPSTRLMSDRLCFCCKSCSVQVFHQNLRMFQTNKTEPIRFGSKLF